MSYYFLAVLDVHDMYTYRQYQQETLPLILPLDVKVHAVTQDLVVLENYCDGDTLVLLEFADEATFRQWWDSEKYAEVKKLRFASAETKLAVAFEQTS